MCDKCSNITMRKENPDFLYCPYCGEEFGVNKAYDAVDTIKGYCDKHKCDSGCKFYKVMDNSCIFSCDGPYDWPDF